MKLEQQAALVEAVVPLRGVVALAPLVRAMLVQVLDQSMAEGVVVQARRRQTKTAALARGLTLLGLLQPQQALAVITQAAEAALVHLGMAQAEQVGVAQAEQLVHLAQLTLALVVAVKTTAVQHLVAAVLAFASFAMQALNEALVELL